MPTSLHHSQNGVGAAKQRSRDRADDVQHAGIAEPSLVPSSSSTSTTYRAILQQIVKQSRAVASSQGATSIRFSTHVTPCPNHEARSAACLVANEGATPVKTNFNH